MRKSDDCGYSPEIACPTEAAAPYYDRAQEAWVLSRYADVLSAFRSPELMPAGSGSKPDAELPDPDSIRSMRAATQDALSAEQLRVWREQLESEAQIRVTKLPTDHPIELIDSYASPLCLSLAAMVTNIAPRDAERLRALSEPVSASAAEPRDAELKKSAAAANASLRPCFHSGPAPLRDSGFVALAHTVPCLVANAWFALLQDERQWNLLHREPDHLAHAVEELLRYAELPRVLFRRAVADVEVEGVSVRKGERVILKVMAANRDPDQFPDAERVDIRRRGVRHLTLGAGLHSCVGASLIRLAIVTLTRPLVERFAHAALDRPVEWKGGSGFRFPAALWVSLKESVPDARGIESHQKEQSVQPDVVSGVVN